MTIIRRIASQIAVALRFGAIILDQYAAGPCRHEDVDPLFDDDAVRGWRCCRCGATGEGARHPRYNYTLGG